MTQTKDLIKKMADFFKSDEYYEKGEDARLELSPDDVRCMNEIIKACGNGVSKQTVLDTISELNAISFYEAQEDSKECYYEIKQAIKDLSPVKQEPKTVLYSGDGYADGYMVYDMAECPNCGREFEDGDETWNCNFCPDCGQALKWKGANE